MNRAAFLVLLLMGNRLALAAEAVSGVNGKLGYSAGSMESDTGQNVSGSFSLPVTDGIGFQGDGLYTNVSERDFYGAGAHLFGRDPNLGLLGITGGVVHEDVVRSAHAGLEVERYLGKLTLTLGAGVATLEYDDPAPFIDTDVTDFYGTMGLRYYPWDDLMLAGSYTHVFDNELVLAELEYQTAVDGLTVFAELAAGEHDYDHALFGLRFYFGGPKRLKARHRQDDPPNMASQILRGMGTYGAEYHQRGRAHARAQGTEYDSNGYGGVIFTMVTPGDVSLVSDASD